jgi:hypothetical protein
MKKSNIKKVVKLLSKTDSQTLTLNEILNNSKISNNEIIEIFNFLIDENLVRDTSSKEGKSISKRTDIDYKNIKIDYSSSNTFPTTINKLAKNPIIQIISILVLLFTFLKILESIFDFSTYELLKTAYNN